MKGCCSCGGTLAEVLDLGLHYLADFIEPGASRGDPQPLRVMLCEGCTLLQLDEFVPRDSVIHERYGFKSGVNEAQAADLHDTALWALAAVPGARSFLDIGCNDGTLLSAVPPSVHRFGVDPLGQFADEAATHADLIVTRWFSAEGFLPGQFDVITSAAMLYAVPDPNSFVQGVRSVLARDGAWVIQVNYALDMIRNNVVDNIFHEHVTYFSVRSLKALLERHGLEISDVTYSPVKGGCIRLLVSHRGARPVSGSAGAALREESIALLAEPATWTAWGRAVRAELGKTRALADHVREHGQRMYVYGASTRGGTFLQIMGAGPDLLPFAVERYGPKVGKVMASTGIPIISEEQMRADPPEYLLVSPWSFRDHFIEREAAYLAAGGRMVFPLPRFEVA